MATVLAFDFGASSGRALLGRIEDGIIAYREIHRFVNAPRDIDGVYSWDFSDLFGNVKEGIRKAVLEGGFDSIGIDTWGVDFGLIDRDGNLIADPVHYRDQRTDGMIEESERIVTGREMYERTGIQRMSFNTVYQLYYLSHHHRTDYDRADKILLMGDLFAYFLTGQMRFELTNASTTSLLDAKTQWLDVDLLEKLGIRTDLFAPTIRNGEAYGTLKPSLCAEFGCGAVPVYAVCTHDTASAVAGVPNVSDDVMYISAGTWSLMGIELRHPILTDRSFTNEIGFDGSIRYLKNIMGSWILQQTRAAIRADGQEVGYSDMEQWARETVNTCGFIDVDDARFMAPGDMRPRINDYLKKTGQRPCADEREFVRVIYESLALKYAYTHGMLERVTGRRFPLINILGGGTQAKLLMQLTADACNVRVTAGPTEATALGNIAAQLIALGEIPTLTNAREKIAQDASIVRYEPSHGGDWREKLQKYASLTEVVS